MGRTRHVWVKPPFNPSESPGLVLCWRQSPDGWEARVIWVDIRTERAVEDWLPADQLRPIKASPSTGSAYG